MQAVLDRLTLAQLEAIYPFAKARLAPWFTNPKHMILLRQALERKRNETDNPDPAGRD